MITEISAESAWDSIRTLKKSYLVDVRSEAEFNFVGVPDDTNFAASYVQIPLLRSPDMAMNKNFAADLSNKLSDKSAPVFFICRSGARSKKAAEIATQLGFADLFNIFDGFEGDLDENGHRAKVNGWKFANLPWIQN